MKPEPHGAIQAGINAGDMLAHLENMKIDPGLPLTGHLELLTCLRDVTGGLNGCLVLETTLAARAVSPHARGDQTPASTDVTERLKGARGATNRARECADNAVSRLRAVCREACRDAEEAPRVPAEHPNVRTARSALAGVSAVRGQLSAALTRTPPVLAALNGHRMLTGSLAFALTRDKWLFDLMPEAIDSAGRDLGGPAGRQARQVADSLDAGRTALHRAARITEMTSGLLFGLFGRVRRGSGGPCQTCGGHGLITAGRHTCPLCGGTGITSEAMA